MYNPLSPALYTFNLKNQHMESVKPLKPYTSNNKCVNICINMDIDNVFSRF